MKNIVLSLLACLPLPLFAQNQDSIAVAKEVDSLLQVNRNLTIEQEFNEALKTVEFAKNKAAAAFGKNSLLYASCLHSEGRTLYQMGQYADAESPYLEAMSIRERISGRENTYFAAILNGLGALYQEMGQYDKAETFFQEAMDIRARVLGKEHALYANSVNALGYLYLAMERYAEAEPLLLDARDIRAKVQGTKHPDYARVSHDLGYLYLSTGKYTKAQPFFQEAVNIMAKTVGTAHQDYALYLNDLADLYMQMGSYAKAELLFLEGKDILTKTSGKEHPDYAVAAFKLANLYLDMGKYADAELLYLEAMDIWAKLLGKDHPTYANASNNLAILYKQTGNYNKAEHLYLEAKDTWAKTLGKERPRYAIALNNLAILYKQTGEHPKAETLYLEVKDIWAKELGKEHPNYADVLNNLAMLYLEMGLRSKAEPLFLESKDIYAKALGKEHPQYATSLVNLAMLYLQMKDYARAEPLLQEAIHIQVKTIGKEHPDYTISLNNLAVLYQETNRISQSSDTLLVLNKIYRHLTEQAAAYSSEHQMFAYLHTFENDLAYFYSFAQAHPNPELIGDSFDNALFYSGFLLENARHLAQAVAEADSLTQDIYARWQGCRRRLANEYTKPVVERLKITEIEAEVEGYEKALARRLPMFGGSSRAPRWQDVQKRLRQGEAAIEFIHYTYYTHRKSDSTLYAALVLLPNDDGPRFVPLFEEGQLTSLLPPSPDMANEPGLMKLYGGPGSKLLQLFWQPLAPLLRDAKTIYYAPSGVLHQINPIAMLDEARQPISEGRQWVRVGSTRTLITGRLADQCFALSSESANQSQSAIVYGGIQYDMDSLAYLAANTPDMADSSRKDGTFRYMVEERPGGNRGGAGDVWTWGALPSTSREADYVSALLREAGFSTEVQKGLSASEERIKKMGTGGRSPRILHLATHGFAFPDPPKNPSKDLIDAEPTFKLLDDPMLRSGLVLAGVNHYWKNKRPLGNFEDGALVAYELCDLDLRNTELAVLSACLTGQGDVVGSEGVYGLQRAFRIAGAKFLIVSLWQVPDSQTLELMRLFYQNWLEKKESLRDAFDHAQQAFRKNNPSPFVWAGFVLVE